MTDGKTCFGVIVGNRGFFPDELARDGRAFIAALLERLGYATVMLGESDTKSGSVETWQDAKKCADLFGSHRAEIDGVIVTLPNFGDERGIADTLKLAGLDVPVLVHAWQDDPERMDIRNRRVRGRGAVHGRPPRDVRRVRRGRDPQHAALAAIHLRERVRASRGDDARPVRTGVVRSL